MTTFSDIFSSKQIHSIRESNQNINIWEGSIRSGKTHASLWRFVHEANIGPAGDFAIVTRTYDTFERNVFPTLRDYILGANCTYARGKRQLFIKERKCHIITADDASAEAKIRGGTFASAYVDEISIIPENVFLQLLGRLSIKGAKLFGTTNPDSPYHWLKKFIDDNPDVKSFKFVMDDNPSLDDERKAFYRRQYKGLWFQRFIEGKWVQAEGAIYDFFNEKDHVIEYPQRSAIYYICGIDYGTSNPCAFVLIGYNPHGYPNLWIEDEYYYNSREKQRQKTDYEYADDFQRFIANKPVKAIYIDPSAASFAVELRQRGVDNLCDANNEVLDGIRFVGKLVSKGALKIQKNCRAIIQEFQSYVWDDKSAKLGVDKPKKENDHCFMSGTSISTNTGFRAIEEIKPQDLVLTSSGFRPVLQTWCRTANVFNYKLLGIDYYCTESHKFYTLNRGFVKISELLTNDIFIVNLCENSLSPLNGMEQNIRDIQTLKHLLTEITIEGGKEELDVDICIEKCGNSIMEKFHPDTIFITKTEIPLTTTLAISNLLNTESIAPFIIKMLRQGKNGALKTDSEKYNKLQKNGTNLTKEENGILRMPKNVGKKESYLRKFANVVKSSFGLKTIRKGFVRINVSRKDEEICTLIMSQETVNFALQNLNVINMQNKSSVRGVVPLKTLGKQNVYNLTVQDRHEFYANNILVANCMDAIRYACFTHFFENEDGNIQARADEIDKIYNQTRGKDSELPPFFRNASESQWRL